MGLGSGFASIIQDFRAGSVRQAIVGLARQFSDRVAGLAGGRLVFEGSPDSLDDTTLAAIYGEPPGPEENDGRFDPVAVLAHA